MSVCLSVCRSVVGWLVHHFGSTAAGTITTKFMIFIVLRRYIPMSWGLIWKCPLKIYSTNFIWSSTFFHGHTPKENCRAITLSCVLQQLISNGYHANMLN